MHDDDGTYPLGTRIGAILGLLALGALMAILADVASGGKIFGDADCGCHDKAGDSIAGN